MKRVWILTGDLAKFKAIQAAFKDKYLFDQTWHMVDRDLMLLKSFQEIEWNLDFYPQRYVESLNFPEGIREFLRIGIHLKYDLFIVSFSCGALADGKKVYGVHRCRNGQEMFRCVEHIATKEFGKPTSFPVVYLVNGKNGTPHVDKSARVVHWDKTSDKEVVMKNLATALK